MTKRTFDINDFSEYDYVVKMEVPFQASDPNDRNDKIFKRKMKRMQEWLDLFCRDKYLILLESVHFISERDAMIFKLGYKYD